MELEHSDGLVTLRLPKGFCPDFEDDYERLFSLREENKIKVLMIILVAHKLFKPSKDAEQNVGRTGLLGRIIEFISDQDMPILMGMSGYVMGQDLELALACDMRFATPESHFGFPGIADGIMPHNGGTQRLVHYVGKGKALEMILTGELIDVESAYQCGLINRIINSEDLIPEVTDLARELSAKSPISLAYVKEAINKGMDLTLEQGLRLEADLYYLMHTTDDRVEGIKAFKEKRKPLFSGT